MIPHHLEPHITDVASRWTTASSHLAPAETSGVQRFSHTEQNMRALAIALRVAAPLFLVAGALHLTLGVGADVLLGAELPAQAIDDPALDSQNRFYGVSFTLYGVLLWRCAADIPRYASVLRCVCWVLFVGGLARLVSVALHGLPPPPVMALLVAELVPPPLLARWLSRVLQGFSRDRGRSWPPENS
jgi:Domain of unknown function (DUF4345)